MASATKQLQQFARQLYTLSFDGRVLSAERVAGVLEFVDKHRPPHALALLKEYRRLVAAEVARGQAVVEHSGPVSDAVLQDIARAMTAKYGRSVTPIARRNDQLLAGLRVRVGDDVYEQSVAQQLAALSRAV
jgi:F-type H+-transporting ATPase subunit delta